VAYGFEQASNPFGTPGTYYINGGNGGTQFGTATSYVILEIEASNQGADYFRIEPGKDPKEEGETIYPVGRMNKPSWGKKQKRNFKAWREEHGLAEDTRVYLKSGRFTYEIKSSDY